MLEMPNPLPRGVVVYANRNSREMGHAYFSQALPNGPAQRLGYLQARGAVINNLPGFNRYRVRGLNGQLLANEVAAPRALSEDGRRQDVRDPDNGVRLGYTCYELMRNQQGNLDLRSDSTGMFRVIGRAFTRRYGGQALVLPFDNVHDDEGDEGTRADTRQNFMNVLQSVAESNLDYFAYAGHGYNTSLPSAQIRQDQAADFVAELRRIVRPDGIIVFYACHTAAVGGFAEFISRQLPQMTVFGHRERGQGSVNPLKYRIRNGQSVEFKSLLSAPARERWRGSLDRDDLYARYPFLTIEQINSELAPVQARRQACALGP